jgi:hypothetical protein
MRLPEIIDQHEDAARFLRLRVEDCTAIKGNCDTVIYWTSNSEDLLVCPMANSCIRNRPDNLVLESKQIIRGLSVS